MCCCNISTKVLLAYIFTYTDDTVYDVTSIYDFLYFLKDHFYTYVPSDLSPLVLKEECDGELYELRTDGRNTYVYKVKEPDIELINYFYYSELYADYTRILTELWYKKYKKRKGRKDELEN